MPNPSAPLARADSFCAKYGLKLPILLAPMAGACPASLSIAVANAGSMGALGALISEPDAIRGWVQEFRSNASGPLQLNTWVPDPAPFRDAAAEARIRAFLAAWGPAVPATVGDAVPLDFRAQCEAFIELRPTVVSSIMGLFPPELIAGFKAKGIAWFATATTLAEAQRAQAAGADAIIAQGYEAGGHRGSFDQAAAERQSLASSRCFRGSQITSICPSLPREESAMVVVSRPRWSWVRVLRWSALYSCAALRQKRTAPGPMLSINSNPKTLH